MECNCNVISQVKSSFTSKHRSTNITYIDCLKKLQNETELPTGELIVRVAENAKRFKDEKERDAVHVTNEFLVRGNTASILSVVLKLK